MRCQSCSRKCEDCKSPDCKGGKCVCKDDDTEVSEPPGPTVCRRLASTHQLMAPWDTGLSCLLTYSSSWAVALCSLQKCSKKCPSCQKSKCKGGECTCVTDGDKEGDVSSSS